MLKKILAQLLAVSFLTGALAVLGGCNTMEGAGRDIERGGQKLQNEANEHR